MINLGLTETQLLARRSALGGSDAPKIMEGGDAWARLWEDKTGRVKPKAVMSEWDSALRHSSEVLQMDWYAHKTGHEVGRLGEIISCKEHPIIRATLDGYDITDNIVLQAKHVSEWTPDPVNWCIEHYSAQVTHEMLACGTDKGMLLIIVGMKEPVWVNFTLDPFFAEAYITRCREFWTYVETDMPPTGAEPMPLPTPPEKMRAVDFDGNNMWSDLATSWLDSSGAAKKFDKAAKGIKEMIEPDIKLATGHGISVTRSKAGALSIKAEK